MPLLDGKPSGEPFTIKPDLGRGELFGLSENGRLLLARSEFRSHIYVTDIDSETGEAAGEAVRLTKDSAFDNGSPVLSRDGTISCASCHIPERAFTNGQPVAEGIQGRRGGRNVPTLFNRAYGSLQLWDGRAGSLEEQALEPIQNPKEMDMTLEEVEKGTA